MPMMFKKSVLAVMLGALAAGQLYAAEVPEGTLLAEKQELVWNVGANPATLDPQKIEGVVETNYAQQLFETLVISDEKGRIKPGAAISWEHSNDFKTWTFHLRPNAKWSNGDPVVAGDFVYAWQRLADPNTAAPYATFLEFVQLKNAAQVVSGKLPVSELGVEAKDEHTLVLHLIEPVPYVDKLVEYIVLAPVNKKVIEQFGSEWTKPGNLVGNGAFILKSAVVNEKTELERNPYYWDNKHTRLDRVTLLPIVSSSTDVARYRAGDEDVTHGEMPIESYIKIKNDLPDELYHTPLLCTYMYEVNMQKSPFNDVKVRKALSLALERSLLTDKVLQQGQNVTYSFTPTFINGGEKITKPEWANWSQTQRNQEAIKLLKEAGFDSNHPLNFKLLYNTSDNYKKLASATQAIWKKNLQGIVNVTLENQEWKTYLDSLHQGNFEVARVRWCADYNEATTFLNYYLSNSTNNISSYKSAEYDRLVSSSFNEPMEEKRAEIYAQAEKVLEKDTALIPVYNYVSPRLIKPWVKGFAVQHPGQNYYLKDVYIIKH
ncbi:MULTISPECIES: ABC transporter substrate-binding protein [unclassified Avibacterium]|uniref:ABC transporter substrate-binding protein n=1 Tax=unclassified Avibacterium TaxID=2685287 RepID=UPI003FA3B959